MSLTQLTTMMAGLAIVLGLIVMHIMRQSRGPASSTDQSATCLQSRTFELSKLLARLRESPTSPAAPKRNRQIGQQAISHAESMPGAPLGGENYYDTIERRLDQAFALYEHGKTDLATFQTTLESIEWEVRDYVAGLGYENSGIDTRHRVGDAPDALLQASWALDAVEWCKNWAVQQNDTSANATLSVMPMVAPSGAAAASGMDRFY
jgi:hypothetical protein